MKVLLVRALLPVIAVANYTFNSHTHTRTSVNSIVNICVLYLVRNQNLFCLSVAVAPHSVIVGLTAAGEHHSAFGNHITPAIFMSLRHISYLMSFYCLSVDGANHSKFNEAIAGLFMCFIFWVFFSAIKRNALFNSVKLVSFCRKWTTVE